MDPAIYVCRYLEASYAAAHPDLTDAARELVRSEIKRNPEAYAHEPHAQALVSYTRVHARMIAELARMEELPDGEFERQRSRLFDETRLALFKIIETDRSCIDARLLDLLLADVPLDDCLRDLLALEREAREQIYCAHDDFDPEAPGLWRGANEDEAAARTLEDPQVIGWLHCVEALSQGSLTSARYRAAGTYAQQVLRARGYANHAEGTLFLALARLEDEDAFFACSRAIGEAAEESPWYLLGRTLLFYKLGRRKNARRALRDFAGRCEGGAFFLLNPTYLTPYLPVRPEVSEAWRRSHQAVWEADGIIADTPDFANWAATVEGVEAASEDFARRRGF